MNGVQRAVIAVAAPVAAEFVLGASAARMLTATGDDFGGMLLLVAIAGVLALPVLSAYCYTRFANPPSGAGWWIFTLNVFAVLAAFLASTRGIEVDL